MAEKLIGWKQVLPEFPIQGVGQVHAHKWIRPKNPNILLKLIV